MSWVYQKHDSGKAEHWHRWTAKRTVKTKQGYEMLERCRSCGELKSTLITADIETGRSFADAKTKTINKTTDNGPKDLSVTQVNTPPTEDSQST